MTASRPAAQAASADTHLESFSPGHLPVIHAPEVLEQLVGKKLCRVPALSYVLCWRVHACKIAPGWCMREIQPDSLLTAAGHCHTVSSTHGYKRANSTVSCCKRATHTTCHHSFGCAGTVVVPGGGCMPQPAAGSCCFLPQLGPVYASQLSPCSASATTLSWLKACERLFSASVDACIMWSATGCRTCCSSATSGCCKEHTHALQVSALQP